MTSEFQQAVQLHQQGSLRDAEIAYRRFLEENPNHADALHLLGVIAHQFGHHADAVDLIGRAIAVNPTCAAYYSNRAEAYRAAGNAEAAIECCYSAIKIEPEYPAAFNNLGLALLRLNRFKDAESAFRTALKSQPNFPSAWNNLGQALREQKREEDACEAYRRAVRMNPQLAEAHNNLGQLLLERREIDEALVHCREAVRLQPQLPEAHSNLGNVFREQGKTEAAIACYREALRLNPQIAMIYNNMGQAVQEHGQIDDAIGWYEQAIQREPETPRFHNNLASALGEHEQFDQAVEHYETAIRLDPDVHESWNGLACAYREENKLDDAVRAFREALRKKEDFAPAHFGLGQTLAELGKLDDAYDCLRQAIACDPQHIGAWSNLATHHGHRLTADDVKQIDALLSDPWLKPGAEAAVHFAQGHIFHTQGDYIRAAHSLERANCKQRASFDQRGETYDPAEHERFVDQIIDVFTTDWFQARLLESKWGIGSDVLVLVIGMPRSGTTLTEQIIASHPDVHGAGELRLGRAAFDRIAFESERTPVAAFQAVDRDATRAAANSYLHDLQTLAPDAHRIVDKMPDNYVYLGWLATLLPNVRIIHCRRDIRAIAMSCWMTSFAKIRWANTHDDIAHRIRQYERLMSHWQTHLPIPMLEIEYEQTVADLPATAQRLVEWLGLPWNESCLHFYQSTRPVRTASVSQVRQPVYSQSVESWKNYESLIPQLFAAFGSGHICK